MNVADTWASPEPLRSTLDTTTVHITLVDAGPEDEQRLLLAARALGLDCSWAHLCGAPAEAQPASGARALLFDAGPDLESVQRSLQAVRRDAYFDGTPAILCLGPEQLASWDIAAGFDDFVVRPYTPLEVRARSRAIEQRRKEADPAGECELDGILVDPVAQEAIVQGRTVRLTARELALLEYLRARRGRVLSRQHLLARVWGHRYRGGPRTVDTHIGRLRLKFGSALPIETVRTNGYRLGRELSADVTPSRTVDHDDRLPVAEAAE
ncbi:MAG TPA: response regulator transcription factor [Polyangiaceae bacterium]|nr:response regulator transcription factor [Polyangiaceae bacterium]